MKIISWNINGIRACTKKGLAEWLDNTDASIVGFQEVRAKLEQVPKEVADKPEWEKNYVAAVRPGYSGVGLYSKKPYELIKVELGEEFDIEGRIICGKFNNQLTILNIYFPNGQGKNRDNSRIPYKLEFYKKLFNWLENYKKIDPKHNSKIIVMGDLNTAHKEIDIARPKANKNASGFCQIERDEVTRWLDAGWIDSFREFNQEPEQYTWWSQMFGARKRNVGWRIDYCLITPELKPFLKDAFIHMDTMGSDHCPAGLELDKKILD